MELTFIFFHAAEKSRLLIGEEASSKSWTGRFTFFNCFDFGTGTIACIAKELVKMYLHYINAVHVRKVREKAAAEALKDGLSQGLSYREASKRACEEGNAAAKRAFLHAKHIMRHLISSGWDVFETLYVGGTVGEGLMRGGSTLLGSYGGGYMGEQRLGWIGFLVGSHVGSWVGGRVGLMAYDVGNGVQYILQIVGKEHSSDGSPTSWGSFL